MGYPSTDLLSGLSDLNLTVAEQFNIEAKLAAIPSRYHADVLAVFKRKYQETPSVPHSYEKKREANIYLLNLQDEIAPRFNFSDEALERKAERQAKECGSILKKQGLDDALSYVLDMGVDEPAATTETGVKKRLACKIWWKRQLFKQQDREQEAFALRIGIVGKFRQIYCSNATHERIQARHEKAREIMAGKEAICGEGEEQEVINMQELLDGSLANPVNRFAEIYTRAKGFESYGNENGHTCQLITITCPSRMHPSSDKYDKNHPTTGATIPF